MQTVRDAVPSMGALVKAVASGELTPTEATELTKMVQALAKIIETAGLKSAFENWKRRSANDAGKTGLETASLGFAEIQRAVATNDRH
jgi:hypothetical protein